MGDVVNLRRARKFLARRAAEETAAEARLKHGTPKAVRELAKARRDAETRHLDAHRRKPGLSDES